MNAFIVKGALVEKYNDEVIAMQNHKHSVMLKKGIRVLNAPTQCGYCMKAHDVDADGKFLAFVVHHICYDSEFVMFVHVGCHDEIHKKSIKQFIQYGEGDSRIYYEQKNKGVVLA